MNNKNNNNRTPLCAIHSKRGGSGWQKHIPISAKLGCYPEQHRLADAKSLAWALTTSRGIHFVDFFKRVSWTYGHAPLYLGQIPHKLIRVQKVPVATGMGDETSDRKTQDIVVIRVVNIWSVSSSARPHPPNTHKTGAEWRTLARSGAKPSERRPSHLLPVWTTSRQSPETFQMWRGRGC